MSALTPVIASIVLLSSIGGTGDGNDSGAGDLIGHIRGQFSSSGVYAESLGSVEAKVPLQQSNAGTFTAVFKKPVIHRSIYCFGMNTGEANGACAVNGGPGVGDPVKPGDPKPITWDDLEDFPADRGAVRAEPAHIIVVGLETNFLSSAKQHVVDGELNGESARVRFTPIEWTWDYGDGTTRHTKTAGSTWAKLSEPEFSHTATSHRYADTGRYTIATSVTFTAEYSVGGAPWTPVAGTLTLGTGTFVMQAYDADTVLVGDTCTENPDGPGC